MTFTISQRVCQVVHCGSVDYMTMWERQRDLARQRSRGEISDTLLLLEHPHTYTLGRATKDGHLLVAPDVLAAQGVAVIESDRGGDISYHGPGQVIGYPIIKLSQHGGDLLRYLRMLEETIIVTLASYDIAAGRIAGLTGVWVGDAKIAAIGVKLSASGVTQHGFALNVATDLHYFAQIIPCGIRGKSVTSLAQVLGTAPPHAEIEEHVARAFGAVFGVTMQPEQQEQHVVH